MRKTLVNFIAKHLTDEIPIESIQEIGVCCAFSGERLTEGVKLQSVIKPATANLSDTFRYPSDYVSPAFAKCFKASRELRGNLFIDAKGIQAPMISAKSAKAKDRPSWRDLITAYLENPRPAVLILTDESKRRLWCDAAVSDPVQTYEAYPQLQMFVNNPDMSQNISLDAITLQQSLALVQECLRAGFSKQAIRTSLFTHRESVLKIGLKETRLTENECAELRCYVEFKVATMIGSVDDA